LLRSDGTVWKEKTTAIGSVAKQKRNFGFFGVMQMALLFGRSFHQLVEYNSREERSSLLLLENRELSCRSRSNSKSSTTDYFRVIRRKTTIAREAEEIERNVGKYGSLYWRAGRKMGTVTQLRSKENRKIVENR
jgi:hypothetical protein